MNRRDGNVYYRQDGTDNKEQMTINNLEPMTRKGGQKLCETIGRHLTMSKRKKCRFAQCVLVRKILKF